MVNYLLAIEKVLIMESNNDIIQENNASESVQYDYDNAGWPRDFDISIEVAEQREVLERS
jgi:hypothetical protein